jgi:hypothetical protein
MRQEKGSKFKQSITNKSNEHGHSWGSWLYYYKSDTFSKLRVNFDNFSDTFHEKWHKSVNWSDTNFKIKVIFASQGDTIRVQSCSRYL